MTVLRLDHFTIDPAHTGELLTRHATPVATVKDAFPGLIGVELAKVDDQMWIDVWRWDSLASAQAAVAGAPAIPRPGLHLRSPRTSPRNTPRSSMRDRTQPVHRKQRAGPGNRQELRRLAWPASPPPPLTRGSAQVVAAWRGGERM